MARFNQTGKQRSADLGRAVATARHRVRRGRGDAAIASIMLQHDIGTGRSGPGSEPGTGRGTGSSQEDKLNKYPTAWEDSPILSTRNSLVLHHNTD